MNTSVRNSGKDKENSRSAEDTRVMRKSSSRNKEPSKSRYPIGGWGNISSTDRVGRRTFNKTNTWESKVARQQGSAWNSRVDRLGTAKGVPKLKDPVKAASQMFASTPKRAPSPATFTPWVAISSKSPETASVTPTVASTVPSSIATSKIPEAVPSISAFSMVQPRGVVEMPKPVTDPPKSALDTLYSKEWKVQRNKDCYVTWHDENQPHIRKFTSILVCPATGETFKSGRYGDEHSYVEKPHWGASFVWYNDKASAEHGAAARAYDCLCLRKFQPHGIKPILVGNDEPYMTPEEAPPLPNRLPPGIAEKIEQQKQLVIARRQQEAQQQQQGKNELPSPTNMVPKSALTVWYTQRPRCHQLSKDSFISWSNQGPPHVLKFTAVFVCPLSGEVFFCGRHGEEYEERQDPKSGLEIIWYNKKVAAEHAAAARAYDCWRFRLEGNKDDLLGQDAPYDKPLENSLGAIPSDKLPVVQQLQAQAKMRVPITATMAVPKQQPDGTNGGYSCGTEKQGAPSYLEEFY